MSWKRTCNVIDRVRGELSSVSRTLTAKCRLTSASKVEAKTAKSVPDCTCHSLSAPTHIPSSLIHRFCFTVFHLYEPVLTDLDIPIENELYFRAVDRAAAEEILKDRIDGSCLVRPYKQHVRTTPPINQFQSCESNF